MFDLSKKVKLTSTEYDILSILWSSEQPLSRADIVERSGDLKTNTANILLKRLLDAGYIKIADYVQIVSANARRYLPALTYEEYAANEIVRQSEGKPFNFVGLVSALSSKLNISQQTIEELEDIINNLKKGE